LDASKIAGFGEEIVTTGDCPDPVLPYKSEIDELNTQFVVVPDFADTYENEGTLPGLEKFGQLVAVHE
jgi:hypothetical protein